MDSMNPEKKIDNNNNRGKEGLLTYTTTTTRQPKTHIIRSMSRLSSVAICGTIFFGTRQFEDRIMSVPELQRLPKKMLCKKCVAPVLSLKVSAALLSLS